MVAGVLFDMDGILFDTERTFMRCDFYAAEQMGKQMTEALSLSFFGTGPALLRQMLRDAFGQDFDAERYLQISHAYFETILEEEGLPLLPGVRETLTWLKEQRVPMAIASSSTLEHVQRNLRMAGLEGIFQAIVAGDMVENSKPAPDIFIAAAHTLSLEPAQCAAVEDSPNGVRSAHAAGCVTIMIPDIIPAGPEQYGLCAAVLDSMHLLPAWLEAWQPG